MKLREYEAKKIIVKSGIATPGSFLVSGKSPDFLPAVIKSQVPVGGRGKAGGVLVVNTQEEFVRAIETLYKLPIKGYVPSVLLAEEVLSIHKEFYLSIVIDKITATLLLIAHRDGGIDVESNHTSDFLRIALTNKNADEIGEQLSEYFDLPDKIFVFQDMVESLYVCFIKNDMTLLEINPFIYTSEGILVAGDCKIELDDAASFRHTEWKFEDTTAEVNFVTLDNNGEVATIANGAGLAMATVDAVADSGMKPANFLDIGGGASESSVLAAFKRILQYPNNKVIIVNIFAGITRCDEVARAIIAAQNQLPGLPPLYIRLAGTNFEEAATLLEAHGIATLATLDECIQAAKREVV